MAPAVLLQRFLSNPQADPEILKWLNKGFTAWWRSGGTVPLTACLHLPATSAACARTVRDTWLRAAAYSLPARSRAETLMREIERFRQAPETSTVHQYLALAEVSGVAIPSSVRQVRNILSETPAGFDFQSLPSAALNFLIHLHPGSPPPHQ
ncbi:hypothetical protein [Variovorax fucosicus]|uniref:hypothetical protein n=1 Tax=Variovorax fucosicus TaxID=3053517 RepID=UPI0025780DE6|nr:MULTISPECIES: hypothetical protein [unclassified Variovorax]